MRDGKTGRTSVRPIPSIQPARLFTGTVPVLVALAGTRWASYIGIPPIYILDVLVTLALIHHMLGRNKARGIFTTRSSAATPLPIRLFLSWAVVRFILGVSVDLDALRDFVPYLYCALAILVAHSAGLTEPATRRNTFRFLMWAIRLHAIWFALVVVFAPGLPYLLPLVNAPQNIHIFDVRGDVDTALCGVYVAFLIRNVLLRRSVPWSVIGIVVFSLAVLGTGSRAGLAGAAIAIVLITALTLRSERTSTSARNLFSAALPIGIVALILLLPNFDIGQRFLSTFGLSTSTNIVDGAGTANARLNAWTRLVAYSVESPIRFLFGTGFGPNFMVDSGAERLLVGEGTSGTSRSPHNFWIGTMIRLGLLGLGLFVAIIVSYFSKLLSVDFKKLCERDELLVLCAAISASLVVPATLGVVFESPFGAIPFYWCIGVLFASLGSKSLTDDLMLQSPAPKPQRTAS